MLLNSNIVTTCESDYFTNLLSKLATRIFRARFNYYFRPKISESNYVKILGRRHSQMVLFIFFLHLLATRDAVNSK